MPKLNFNTFKDKLRTFFCFSKKQRVFFTYSALILMFLLIVILRTVTLPTKIFYGILGVCFVLVVLTVILFTLSLDDDDVSSIGIDRSYFGTDCIEWYDIVKEESRMERLSDDSWRGGRYLHCVLLQCIDKFRINDPAIDFDKLLHVKISRSKDSGSEQIDVMDDKARKIAQITDQTSKANLSLLKNGARLFLRVYRKKDFYGMVFVVAEVYIGEDR